MTAYLLHI